MAKTRFPVLQSDRAVTRSLLSDMLRVRIEASEKASLGR